MRWWLTWVAVIGEFVVLPLLLVICFFVFGILGIGIAVDYFLSFLESDSFVLLAAKAWGDVEAAKSELMKLHRKMGHTNFSGLSLHCARTARYF